MEQISHHKSQETGDQRTYMLDPKKNVKQKPKTESITEKTSHQESEDQRTYTVTQETEDQRTYSVEPETQVNFKRQSIMKQISHQKSESQSTYPVTQETGDHRTYSVEPETEINFIRKTSGHSTVPTVLDPELISVCDCLFNDSAHSSEEIIVSERKRKLFSHCFRVETYLRERRIPELIRFILAKIMCSKPANLADYVANLLDDCMTCRSGYGKAPVLFKERHLEAVVRSFDPCNRGWLSAGQVRRAFTTLGLTSESYLDDKTPTREVLEILRETQERELLRLLSAGSEMEDELYSQ